ncbi:lipopolysaccharide biosynthesis protein [Aeromonas enteropelogenes]|uniref:lipopolysaccharide biosynthesis protein n=1 Tax=Aeromonas enteropelogenes TaxID=29489 RepID=UPI003B9FB9CF
MTSSILISLLCRGIQVVCGLFVVKNLINILGVEEYGIWVTMTSMVAWMALFDFGIGYGLKNKISEAAARNNYEDVSYWITIVIKCYLVISLILLFLFGVFATFSSPFKDYPFVSLILIVCATLSFFFSTGSIILQALGNFKKLYLFNLIHPVFWLLVTTTHYWFSYTIFQISLIYALLILSQGWLVFKSSTRNESSIYEIMSAKFDVLVLKRILSTGIKFFLIQICNLGLFMTGNYIAYRFFGGVDAAVYDTINKVFQLFTVGFSIFVSVFWTEISKAKAEQDRAKKIRCFRLLMILSFMATLTAIVFSYYIEIIVSIITDGKLEANYYQALPFALLVAVQSFAYSGAVFMNAYEQLKIQVWFAIISLPLFSLMVFLMIRMNHGFSLIPLASAIAIVPSMLVCLFYGYRLAKQ